MSEKFNGAVTAMGTSLIAKAIANNTKMSFLKIVGSKSTYTDKQLPTLTDDVLSSASHDQEGHISNVTIADETTIKTELVLDGSSVEADYQLNTVLILATVDGTDHLFGVLKANQPQYMNAYDGKSSTNLEINCSFKVANTDAVSITVDTRGTLTVDDYNRLLVYTDTQLASASGVANKRMDSAVAVEAKDRAAAVTSESTARSSAVAAEVTARSNAVSGEASARAAADTKLQNSASTAASDIAVLRTSAASYTDTKVQSAATVASNATSTEAVNRTSAVAAESTARSNAVSAEAVKRAAADSTESSARAAADTKLQTSATANATAAAKAQTTANNASSAVVNEATARSAADIKLQGSATANSAAAAKAQSTADSKFAGMKQLPANTDLNNVSDPGMYYNPSDADVKTFKNSPTTHSFSLQVVQSAGRLQFLTEYMADTSAHIWYRAQYSTAWGSWRQIALIDQDTAVSGYYAFTNSKGMVIRDKNPKLDFDAGNGGRQVVYGYPGADGNGDGLGIGAGGVTAIGSGESSLNFLQDLAGGKLPTNIASLVNAFGDEKMFTLSDGPAYVITNFQNNDASAKVFLFGADGSLEVPGTLKFGGKTAASIDQIPANTSWADIELNSKGGGTAFIDFHKTGLSNDYDARIILEGSPTSGANGTGNLNILGTDVKINSNSVATQPWVSGAFASKQYADTRNDNQNPKWYLTNHSGQGNYYELKTLSKIGITAAILPSGITNTYGACFTTVGPSDGGAGYPDQLVKVFGKAGGFPVYLHRSGVSDTAWSKWYLEPIIERG